MSNDPSSTKIRLNKFVGQSGLCTRREAAHRIKGGLIKVNGAIIKDPATLISTSDLVTFGKKVLKPKVDYTYVLINKPKNTHSDLDNESKEKNLAKVLGNKVKEILTPIEPLSKNDTGLMLLTNDTALIEKLNSYDPKSEVVYHVTLDQPLTPDHMSQLLDAEKTETLAISGIHQLREKESMADIEVDVCLGQYVSTRAAFEKLGYQVIRMDRLYYNGLTKKDLPRDRFRHLTDKEVILIKHFA